MKTNEACYKISKVLYNRIPLTWAKEIDGINSSIPASLTFDPACALPCHTRCRYGYNMLGHHACLYPKWQVAIYHCWNVWIWQFSHLWLVWHYGINIGVFGLILIPIFSCAKDTDLGNGDITRLEPIWTRGFIPSHRNGPSSPLPFQ